MGPALDSMAIDPVQDPNNLYYKYFFVFFNIIMCVINIITLIIQSVHIKNIIICAINIIIFYYNSK